MQPIPADLDRHALYHFTAAVLFCMKFQVRFLLLFTVIYCCDALCKAQWHCCIL